MKKMPICIFPKVPIRFVILLSLALSTLSTTPQTAKVTETAMTFTTYPFSDPNPVPETGRIYPYFYFHGYTNTSVEEAWNMVILENEYIKVYVCPDIGGKIWGALEKSTGKEFLYFNHVVKFRDVAMRGAWTSGGLEYNFGDIGHIPTCATPVDYTTAENEDGSVSCTVGAIDLPSGTRWNVEIKVSPGKAYFETKASWFNNTALPCTYYHWMNAAARASDDLEFLYPGKDRIGHGGETGPWPVQNGRDLSWYRNNDFGSYKSYHVLNSYSDFFGGYWHEDNFGFGRHGDFDEKPGKKLWIWGLSEQGMIWEDILTDSDGQYIEFQAGKLFNQAAGSSTLTPFKHKEFAPHDGDVMREIWFPLKGTGGMVAASPFGILNVERTGNLCTLTLSALQALHDTLLVFINGERKLSERITLQPLELFKGEINAGEADLINIVLGDHKLSYSSANNATLVDRPVDPNPDFDWKSAYGHFTKGLEFEKQRAYMNAEKEYRKALDLEPGFLPALSRMALTCFRKMEHDAALVFVNRALAINTYDGETNYLLGLIARETGEATLSKSGFSVAMGDVAHRSAAATELATTFLAEKDWRRAERYAQKALNFNAMNLDALKSLALAQRHTGQKDEAKATLYRIASLDPTDPFSLFEQYFLSGDPAKPEQLVMGITNEFPYETLLDLAIGYKRKGCKEEAHQVLKLASDHPVVNLWLAFLDPDNKENYLDACLHAPCDLVFPHRIETASIIREFLKERPHWKLHYYLGLILWNKGLPSEATEHFTACGNEPDFAPYHLAMAGLEENKEDQLEHLQRATILAPDSWRSALALSDHYRSLGQYEEAISIIQPFLKQYPERSAVGLAYARLLVDLEQYEESVTFLEGYDVLPFEGATAGRDLYNEACIRMSLRSLNVGDHKNAIHYANKAKNYPLNLGVGKPYDLDERLEDYILSNAYSINGDEKQAALHTASVMNYTHPQAKQENSRLYLQLTLIMENGQQKKAAELADHYSTLQPQNWYVHWAVAKINNSPEIQEIQNKILNDRVIGSPYEAQIRDKGFLLVLEALKRQ